MRRELCELFGCGDLCSGLPLIIGDGKADHYGVACQGRCRFSMEEPDSRLFLLAVSAFTLCFHSRVKMGGRSQRIDSRVSKADHQLAARASALGQTTSNIFHNFAAKTYRKLIINNKSFNRNVPRLKRPEIYVRVIV